MHLVIAHIRETKFKQFTVFFKQTCNHMIINGKEVIFGSLWRFVFNYLSGEKQKIIQFGFDAGFGELNSLGFMYELVEMTVRKNN